MVKDEEVFERALADELKSYIDAGIRNRTSVLARVQANLGKLPSKTRRRPRTVWLLPAVAIVAGLLGGAVYAETLGAPIVIKFLGGPRPAPVSFGNSRPIRSCDLSRPTTLATAQRTLRYHILTLAPSTTLGTATLTQVVFAPGCGAAADHQGVYLDYLVDDVSVQLSEGPAENAKGPLVIGIKGNSLPSDIELRMINGQQYAVWMMPEPNKFDIASGVTSAEWQTGGTAVYLNVIGRDARGMVKPVPWQTFQDIVEHLR
jgi:hypothetical protein